MTRAVATLLSPLLVRRLRQLSRPTAPPLPPSSAPPAWDRLHGCTRAPLWLLRAGGGRPMACRRLKARSFATAQTGAVGEQPQCARAGWRGWRWRPRRPPPSGPSPAWAAAWPAFWSSGRSKRESFCFSFFPFVTRFRECDFFVFTHTRASIRSQTLSSSLSSSFSHGVKRLGSRGNRDVLRMLSSPQNSITTRSNPTPAPACG